MKISLLGYMGSGKSHIARLLSAKLKYQLIDLDQEIERLNHKSVAEIFEEKGELYFRKKEKEALHMILDTEDHIVISVGGGTPVYYDNIQELNAKTKSFYLRSSVPTLTSRLAAEREKRPLIARIPHNDLPEFIGKHLFERNHFYTQAQHAIDTDHKTPEEIVDEILKYLD